jgi:hypothetical protein
MSHHSRSIQFSGRLNCRSRNTSVAIYILRPTLFDLFLLQPAIQIGPLNPNPVVVLGGKQIGASVSPICWRGQRVRNYWAAVVAIGVGVVMIVEVDVPLIAAFNA